MIKQNDKAWFYNFEIGAYCIFLNKDKQKAATLNEALELVKDSGTYMVLSKNLKFKYNRLWVPEHHHKIVFFPTRKLMVEVIRKTWEEFVKSQVQYN